MVTARGDNFVLFFINRDNEHESEECLPFIEAQI